MARAKPDKSMLCQAGQQLFSLHSWGDKNMGEGRATLESCRGHSLLTFAGFRLIAASHPTCLSGKPLLTNRLEAPSSVRMILVMSFSFYTGFSQHLTP